MSEIHVATSGPKAREMVKAVLVEFDRWAKHAASQAAGIELDRFLELLGETV